MTDLTPNDLSDEEFLALSPQGEHAPGPEPLSPTAQAVLDAVQFEVNAERHAPWIAAAAIRALADQVVPPGGGNFIAVRIRATILAIATELEGQ